MAAARALEPVTAHPGEHDSDYAVMGVVRRGNEANDLKRDRCAGAWQSVPTQAATVGPIVRVARGITGR
jgi:hypothetical protein